MVGMSSLIAFLKKPGTISDLDLVGTNTHRIFKKIHTVQTSANMPTPKKSCVGKIRQT